MAGDYWWIDSWRHIRIFWSGIVHVQQPDKSHKVCENVANSPCKSRRAILGMTRILTLIAVSRDLMLKPLKNSMVAIPAEFWLLLIGVGEHEMTV